MVGVVVRFELVGVKVNGEVLDGTGVLDRVEVTDGVAPPG